MKAVTEQGRIWRLALGHVWQNGMRWVHGGPVFRFLPSPSAPERLIIAPQDLRTADETNAADIYGGRFLFSGHLIETHGRSPFLIEGANADWYRALHGFGWLRDLRATSSQVSRKNARVLVDDWITHCGRWDKVAWQPPVVTRRMLSWLSHSPFLLEDSDHEFYSRFLRALARHLRYLRRTINDTHDGVERLQAALAIAAGSVCLSGHGRFTRQALRRLDYELNRQILPDGGHVSRSPGAIIQILADLLPVRQVFMAQGLEMTGTVMQSVDRMMPILRFFRHADGALAHFNGMGSTPNDLVATIMAYDDARGAPPSNAPHSGYQRLSGGQSLVLMDTGRPPRDGVSGSAHAGCLSFEFSSGLNRLVVNCGVSARASDAWRKVSRSTAAHSTASLEDTSSCRFLADWPFGRWLGAPVVSGPTIVPVERHEDDAGTRVTASHDGYLKSFGIIHCRDIRLAGDGTVLDGIDSFPAGGPERHGDQFAIRFHLHPAIKASLLRGGAAILLACPDGEAWEFDSPGQDLALEDSIYLSDVYGHRKTLQLVIYGRISSSPTVVWQFRRTAVARPERRPLSRIRAQVMATPELPLDDPQTEDADISADPAGTDEAPAAPAPHSFEDEIESALDAAFDRPDRSDPS
ncbi:heparinase II/III family protein [Roseibium aestuarii]|uniref:Heparinase II/III family protein n=1 Tax=Roseibium aestuarii TaxID=2600299 RepID=A0ABW4K2S7_9HYPH|nr:heparinase II/III family protein [Roseibium aestuarii]